MHKKVYDKTWGESTHIIQTNNYIYVYIYIYIYIYKIVNYNKVTQFYKLNSKLM